MFYWERGKLKGKRVTLTCEKRSGRTSMRRKRRAWESLRGKRKVVAWEAWGSWAWEWRPDPEEVGPWVWSPLGHRARRAWSNVWCT